MPYMLEHSRHDVPIHVFFQMDLLLFAGIDQCNIYLFI